VTGPSSTAAITSQAPESTSIPSQTSEVLQTATTSSTGSPSTPVAGPNGDFLAVNLYTDDSCQDFAIGYLGQDIYEKCHQITSLSSVGINSYQFVWEQTNCQGLSSGDTADCIIYDKNGCSLSSVGVGSGCGNDKSCQKTNGGSGYFITTQEISNPGVPFVQNGTSL